jgi:superfamily I DNA/RNA helicase
MANITLRPNVVLHAIPAENNWIRESDIAARLTYHERLRMSQIYPILFPWSDLYSNPTSHQRSQFLQFARGQIDVWADLELKPLPVTTPVSDEPSLDTGTPSLGTIEQVADEDLGAGVHDLDLQLPTSEVNVSSVESPSDRPAGEFIAEAIPTEPIESEASCEDQISVPSADLDPQRAAIFASSQINLVVSAPPGTGKTHALIERICQLLPYTDGPISDQIVVLSFTRATVAEIMRRLRERAAIGFQDNLRYVNVRTFDSYATRLLLCDKEPEQLRGLGYDKRIDSLLQGVAAGTLPNADSTIRRIRWLLVDEIQDLVGVRARLVVHLLRKILAAGGAVSLFGDPSQSIYDFQVQDGWSSARFFSEANSALPETTQRYEFQTFHRYTEPKMVDFIRRARKCAASDDFQEVDGNHLLGLIRELDARAQVTDLASILQDHQGPTAVLTRSNLQVEQLAQWCGDRGLPYEVNAGAVGSYWPAWIAILFSGWAQEEMSLDQLRRRHDHYSSVNPNDMPSIDAVMALLRREGTLGNETVDVALLGEIVLRRLPVQDVVGPNPQRHLRLSTVHKAKGLEYDHVLVLEPDNNFDGSAEECRVLYVAATRARRTLKLLKKDSAVFRAPSFQCRELGHKHVSRQRINYLYLEGIDDLDISTWSDHGHPSENIRRYSSGDFSIASPSGRDYYLFFTTSGGETKTLCKTNSSLSWDLGQLLRRFGKAGSTALFAALKPRRFATVSLIDTGYSGVDSHGIGGFVLAPVIQGESKFDVI